MNEQPNLFEKMSIRSVEDSIGHSEIFPQFFGFFGSESKDEMVDEIKNAMNVVEVYWDDETDWFFTKIKNGKFSALVFNEEYECDTMIEMIAWMNEHYSE